MKLTDSAVAKLKLPPGRNEHIEWDDDIPGFGARLRRSGVCTWIFQYRFRRATKRITIGNVSAIKAADARSSASRFHAQVRLDIDPGAGRDKPRSGQDETFGATVDLYLNALRERVRPKSFIDARRYLEVHAKSLHRSPLTEVDRRDIARLIASLGASSGKGSANAASRSLSAFFGWCQREGLLDVNPATNINRFPERSRERVLTDDELARIWRATEIKDRSAVTNEWANYAALVRMLMLLGCRREELGALRWSEVDLDAATIKLKAERVKNAKPHVIVLSAAAVAILKDQPRIGDGFVFGARGFNGWARSKVTLDKLSGVDDWRVHDFRRTLSTVLNETLDIAPHVVEAILGHTIKGIASVYNKAGYIEQRRIALEAWAAHLAVIVEGRSTASNVVSIR